MRKNKTPLTELCGKPVRCPPPPCGLRWGVCVASAARPRDERPRFLACGPSFGMCAPPSPAGHPWQLSHARPLGCPEFSKRAPAPPHGERARWRAPSGERNLCELTQCRPRVPSTPPCDTAMFRNQYDTDVTTWSPQGRLHQVTCPAPPLHVAVWTALLTFAVRSAVARAGGRLWWRSDTG